MSGLETAVAAMNVAEMTLKVLKVGVTIISDARNYGKDAKTLGLKFQQLAHRYDSAKDPLSSRQIRIFAREEPFFPVA